MKISNYFYFKKVLTNNMHTESETMDISPSDIQTQEEVRKISNNMRWLPPEEDHVKCNIDAGIISDQRSHGIGICIRNSQSDLSNL